MESNNFRWLESKQLFAWNHIALHVAYTVIFVEVLLTNLLYIFQLKQNLFALTRNISISSFTLHREYFDCLVWIIDHINRPI